MVERIRQILATRGLSPTQFADTIGIGRPVVSHILSGRNKPSLEVMQKIMDAFPELALPWLLKGEGPMVASATANAVMPDATAPVAAPSKKKQRAPTSTPAEPSREAVKPRKELIDSAVEQAQADQTAQQEAAPPATPVAPLISPAPVAPAPSVAATLPAALAAAPTDKAIRRIIIFYQDGTFTDYQPEK